MSAPLDKIIPQQAEQQAEQQSDALTEAALPAMLDLLVPWDLPTTLNVSTDHLDIITGSLDKLEAILLSEHPRASDVAALLADMPATGAVEQKLKDTGSPVKPKLVVEYDRYFLIRHVHCNLPEFVILIGLIETYQVFLSLYNPDNEQDDEHNAEQMEIQRRGFIEYIAMLRRMLDTGEQA